MPKLYEENEKRPIVHRQDRTIFFFDNIDSLSVCEAIRLVKILEDENSKDPIEFIINSDGGYCYDGLALYDKLRLSPCPIITIGTGWVASMAVIIYLAGERRFITQNTTIMHHQAAGELEGKVSEIKIEAEEIRRLDDICTEITAERTGQSIRKLKNDIKIGNKYLSAEQAVEEGFAHDVATLKKTPKPKRKRKSSAKKRKK